MFFSDVDVAGVDSYGWKNLRKIGKQKLSRALRNADGLSYTVIAAKLITLGFTVNEDGVVMEDPDRQT